MPEVPPEEQPVPPVKSTVEKDIASDAAGEARDDTPTPPPPGTRVTGYFESSGFKAAVAAWAAVGFMVARAAILQTPVSREALAALSEVAGWTTLASWGIQKASDSLRYK